MWSGPQQGPLKVPNRRTQPLPADPYQHRGSRTSHSPRREHKSGQQGPHCTLGDFLMRKKRSRRREARLLEAYSWGVLVEGTRVLSSWALCKTWGALGSPSASSLSPALPPNSLMASRRPRASRCFLSHSILPSAQVCSQPRAWHPGMPSECA